MQKTTGPSYDVAKMRDDMALHGWIQMDLARKAGISYMTVARFLSGERQSARMAKKMAAALGYSVRRYLISSREAVAS